MIEAGPNASPVVPRYGAGALCDTLSSAVAALGVDSFANVLGLPKVRAICVLLVDGLGWNLLLRRAADAPFLASIAADAAPITAGYPSTTATSLTSLGTGLPPGQHGMVGYKLAIPGEGRMLDALRWDVPEIDPLRWQPNSTVFDRAVEHGCTAFHVLPGAFEGSGLTVAGLRGAQLVAAETPGDLVAGVAGTLRYGDATLVYAYHSELDKTGHLRGCGSAAWGHQLAVTDRLVERMAATLPSDTALVVTGDHGMVDVPPERRIDVDTHPDLSNGVAMLGGEPRSRHVYTVPGAAADTLATWRAVLGADAWVVSREEAVALGWFGPDVRPEFLPRIGDVVAAAATDIGIVASVAEPRLSLLPGQHGSLTPDEQLVPLLVIRPDGKSSHGRGADGGSARGGGSDSRGSGGGGSGRGRADSRGTNGTGSGGGRTDGGGTNGTGSGGGGSGGRRGA